MGLSGVVEFTRVGPGGRWVHPVSLVALVFNGFTRRCWFHWHLSWESLGSQGFAVRVVGFMWCHWVHSGSPLELLGLSGDVGLTLVRPAGSSVHLRSMCVYILGFALLVVRYIQGRWVHSHSPWVSLGSSRVVRFTLVRLVGGWIHPGSFGSLWFALRVVRFI